jgi:adenylate cyclase
VSEIVQTQRIECRSSSAMLWPVLADTERLNREAGLSEIEKEELPPTEMPARYRVKSKFGPLELEWYEYPFEWQEGLRFGVHRKITKGPIHHLDFQVALEASAPGTIVQTRIAVLPNLSMLSPVLRVAVDAFAHRIGEAVKRFDKQLQSPRSVAPAPAVDAAAMARVAIAAKAELGKEVAPLIDRLVDHLRVAPDHQVGRIRPYALADQLGLARRPFLESCLGATVGGLLELRWDVICPSCRTASRQLEDLAEIGDTGHCHLCDLSFGVDLDRSVEASFRPAKSVRDVPEIEFCTGGPAVMPHVIAQAVVGPGESKVMSVPSDAGRYRIYARGGGQCALDVRPGSALEATITVGTDLLDPSALVISPGGKLTIATTAAARHVKLERLEWSSLAATAHEVSTIGAFRRQFSTALVKPGLGLKVGKVALLFSDLSASTQLYAREGDAAAFALVQAHFDLLKTAIEGHEGAVVKTIGDAVMAAFTDDLAAVRAAKAMLAAFPEFRGKHPSSEGVYLKVGVYAGACYAVTANGALDYFGQSVNVAARIQGQAEANELVLPEELGERAIHAGVLERGNVSAPYDAVLKGVAAPIRCVRARF